VEYNFETNIIIKEKKTMDAVDTIKILGSLLGNGGLSKGSGGNVLGNILGNVMGNAQNQKTQGGDMLGNVLGNLLGGGQSGQSSSGGGMGDLLGSLLGGATGGKASSGGMGDLLGSLLGGGSAHSETTQSKDSGLGGLLGSALSKYAQAKNPNMPNPTHDQTDILPEGLELEQAQQQAELIIRAMINAAKADGTIDREEQEKIIEKMGDLSEAEKRFLREEFAKPLDVEGFIRSVPKEMQPQVYLISLSAIDLDTNKEAGYLAQLAEGFGFSAEFANELHERAGAPKIFNA